jgi:putative oxidoreductase
MVRIEFIPSTAVGRSLHQGLFMNSNRLPDLAALLLRVALGVLYLAHSLQKILVFTLPGTAQFFVSLGLPGWLGYLTAFVELLGGIALLLGVQVRWVALVLLPFMLGAMSAHLHNGWGFASPNGGWEYPAFWAVTLVVQALLGGGVLAMSSVNAPRAAVV